MIFIALHHHHIGADPNAVLHAILYPGDNSFVSSNGIHHIIANDRIMRYQAREDMIQSGIFMLNTVNTITLDRKIAANTDRDIN